MRTAIVAAALLYAGAGLRAGPGPQTGPGLQAGAAAGPKTVNPIPYTKESILRGRNTYLRHCQECHDEDGKAMSNAIAAAADLTRPDAWKHGAEDEQAFASIRNGAGDAMPPFRADLKDDQIWDIVNFVRSIGPESRRPKPPRRF